MKGKNETWLSKLRASPALLGGADISFTFFEDRTGSAISSSIFKALNVKNQSDSCGIRRSIKLWQIHGNARGRAGAKIGQMIIQQSAILMLNIMRSPLITEKLSDQWTHGYYFFIVVFSRTGF